MSEGDTLFLREAPRSGIDHVGTILLLDFDGVLNRLSGDDQPTLPRVPGTTGRVIPIDLIDFDVFDALHEAVVEDGVWLGWLTSWGAHIAVLEEMFLRRLYGGFVVAERPAGVFVPMDWKHDAALKLSAQYPLARVVWVDDDGILAARRHGTIQHRLSHALLIAPRAENGLKLEDAVRINAHLRGMD